MENMMNVQLNPRLAAAMSATDHLQCVCGFLAFVGIRFPEPGVMKLTCWGCGLTHTINVGAASNLAAWQRAEQESQELPPVEASKEAEPEQFEPVRSGYKYEAMF